MNGNDLKAEFDAVFTALREEFTRERAPPGLWERVETTLRRLETAYKKQHDADEKAHVLSESGLREREEMIREQLQEIETIYETAPVGLGLLDTDLRFLRINERLAEMNGIPAADHLERSIPELLPELGSQAKAIVRRIQATGKPALNMEVSGETPAQPGVHRHWVEHWYPLQAPDGSIRAINIVVEEVTGKRAIERTLQESEKQYRSLVNNLSEGVWVVDEHADTLFVNPQMAEMLGYTVEEMKGRNLGEFLSENTRQKLSEDEFERLKISRESEERVFICRGGQRICVLISTSPFFDEEGHFKGTVAGVLDITERKRTEEDVRETKEFLESLIAYANAPIIVWDRDLKITRFNRAFEHLTGRSESEMIGQHLRTLFPSETADSSLMRIQETLAGERWETVEIPVLGARGTIRTVLWNSASIFSPDGSLRAVIAQGSDISERKQVEEDLRASLERLEYTQRAARIGFWDWNMITETLVWSPEFYEQFGLSPSAKASFETWLSVVHTDDREHAMATINQSIEDRESLESEYRIILPDGQERWINALGDTIYDADDRPIRMSGVCIDITEHKKSEDALIRYANNLQQSNRDLEQFAYVASHDLQEPLRTVVSFSQLLKRRYGDKLGKDADEYIGFIVDAGNRMQAQIHDLLEYSRVSTRGQEITQVESETVLEEAKKDLQTKIRRSGAIITHDPLPAVLADASQLRQVFQNLLSNAIKFSQVGSTPKIHISAKSLGDRWQFSVRDNGIGIEPEFAERIFVIFQRLHTRSEYPGTGIGLAICKRIIDRHEGEMWVESEPGAGSTFHFTVPALPE
ncbi:MAG: PAS domain S-box protein [Methanomicrobiaceae archaeon]|nr:PAS domain S-box protein [Methanomicrobiaceae archaeon]